MGLDRMAQWQVGKDSIVVLAANFLAFDKTVLLEISNNPLDRTLSYPSLQSDFTQNK
jgi:hypothetical protein